MDTELYEDIENMINDMPNASDPSSILKFWKDGLEIVSKAIKDSILHIDNTEVQSRVMLSGYVVLKVIADMDHVINVFNEKENK